MYCSLVEDEDDDELLLIVLVSHHSAFLGTNTNTGRAHTHRHKHWLLIDIIFFGTDKATRKCALTVAAAAAVRVALGKI